MQESPQLFLDVIFEDAVGQKRHGKIMTEMM
jgi:hypothetical protein